MYKIIINRVAVTAQELKHLLKHSLAVPAIVEPRGAIKAQKKLFQGPSTSMSKHELLCLYSSLVVTNHTHRVSTIIEEDFQAVIYIHAQTNV